MIGWLIGARAILARIPWQAWAILALLAVWYVDRTRHGNARAYEARVEMIAKYEAAARQAQAKLDPIPKETDRAVIQARIKHHDRTERFIASGGVRPCPATRDPALGSAGSGEALRPAPVVDGTQPVQVVTVTAEDVRICTGNTLLAEGLRDHVLRVEAETSPK